MEVCGYTAILEPDMGRISLNETIESLYDHIDSFVVLDLSNYDRWDGYQRYGKVKYVKGIYNPFDDPFGSMFTQALKLAESDYVMFLDSDEIFSFPSNRNLKEIVAPYDVSQRAISFYMVHHYCSRYFSFPLDVVPTKGAHFFKNNSNYIHDLIPFQSTSNGFRRWNKTINMNDGVRIVNMQTGTTLEHYAPLPREDVLIHHTSHIDYFGKVVRNFVQLPHIGLIDTKEYVPCDIRLTPEEAAKVYKAGEDCIKQKKVSFFQTEAVPYDYKPNKLVDEYVKRFDIVEFNPFDQEGYIKTFGKMWREDGE